MGRGGCTSSSSMTTRAPSQEERSLWRAAMRGVTPLADTAPPPETRPPAESPRVTRSRAAAPSHAKPLPELASDAAPGLDRRSAERLKRGQLPIEARLDLHGMTQQEAHGALEEFLARAEARGLRAVLVITGKSGVLRKAVPRWLNEPANRPRLLAFAPAQPKDGGAGALYLLLRRKR
jgi:DNA-nicking Smr family endonuclease